MNNTDNKPKVNVWDIKNPNILKPHASTTPNLITTTTLPKSAEPKDTPKKKKLTFLKHRTSLESDSSADVTQSFQHLYSSEVKLPDIDQSDNYHGIVDVENKSDSDFDDDDSLYSQYDDWSVYNGRIYI